MANPIITPEDGVELKRLYTELDHAAQKANSALKNHGMDSEVFLEADREVARIVHRMKQILGTVNLHWMEA